MKFQVFITILAATFVTNLQLESAYAQRGAPPRITCKVTKNIEFAADIPVRGVLSPDTDSLAIADHFDETYEAILPNDGVTGSAQIHGNLQSDFDGWDWHAHCYMFARVTGSEAAVTRQAISRNPANGLRDELEAEYRFKSGRLMRGLITIELEGEGRHNKAAVPTSFAEITIVVKDHLGKIKFSDRIIANQGDDDLYQAKDFWIDYEHGGEILVTTAMSTNAVMGPGVNPASAGTTGFAESIMTARVHFIQL